jgi:predicted SprT family Zn-dependent metalloprotease
MEGTSDDELPELATLLPPRASSAGVRRQSPRKALQQNSLTTKNELSSDISATARQTRTSPTKPARATAINNTSQSKRPTPAFSLSNVPVLPRQGSRTEVSASSNNVSVRSSPMRSIGLTHVDSLLLPLSKISLDAEARPKPSQSGSRGLAAPTTTRPDGKHRSKPSVPRQVSSNAGARKFILHEAACADDFENSLIDDEEDTDTDLSGFLVDDDVEPSIHDSSSDSEVDRKTERKPSVSPRKRRLQQGSQHRKIIEAVSHDNDSEGTAGSNDGISGAFRDLNIEEGKKARLRQDVEIIDLTSSPVRTHDNVSKFKVNIEEKPNGSSDDKGLGNPTSLFKDFDAIMKFSPPSSSTHLDVPSKLKMGSLTLQRETGDDEKIFETNLRDGFTTPPTTPPRSPSKLKSPSKPLSPSKRAAQVEHSPHRQSIDGFWDLEVVNTWNDTYSPKKAPITSPRKNRFLEWMDSSDEDDETPTGLSSNTPDSLPSPCSSPRKSRSPQRSPEKAEKQSLLSAKRSAKAAKQSFDSRKESLAVTLLHLLDTHITSRKISTLSASTGGVSIIWSKTLRSTAGRANWRRTVVSPVKGRSTGSTVQHYASIELATKVIDCEVRLVNTLAHEFCHLANFMVSGVRDQPHGASFKAWASKVTGYLRDHEERMYHGVEVTTKHSYVIEHKYLWVCAGRDMAGIRRVLIRGSSAVGGVRAG